MVCGDEAVGGEVGTMLWWVAALLCCQRCCEKVCGKCESSVWKECRLCHPQEALQNQCRPMLSPPCAGSTLSDGKTGLCSLRSTGRDLPLPGETPRLRSYCCCHLGQPGVLGQGRGIGLGMGLALYTTICSDLCSSSVIHSFYHQIKIPVG